MNIIPLNATYPTWITTTNPTTGASQNADATPTYRVFTGVNTTPLLGPSNYTNLETGAYFASFSVTAANGFVVGDIITVLSSATVNSISGKYIAEKFRVAPAESVTGVPKVDVSHVAGTAQTAGDIIADTNDIQTSLITIASYIDTEVAAIKAKTDNLPASPAATSDIPTAVANADALLGRNVSGGSSAGRTVKQALHVLRNKTDIAAGTLTVYETDDTTPSFTATVTTTAGNPISQIDPA